VLEILYRLEIKYSHYLYYINKWKSYYYERNAFKILTLLGLKSIHIIYNI